MNNISSNQSTVVFEAAGKQQFLEHFEAQDFSTFFVLVDQNTKKHCLSHFLSWFSSEKQIEVIEIPAGEEHKHLETCQMVWEQLSSLGADRKSVLINLGGGVVSDLGGFVACAFKRGIAFYNIPTTLLSMVDASVGGKTGVDLGVLKNQIGIIQEPEMVLVLPQWLNTLPQEELRSGFAEMLKHGLIADEPYWNALKKLDHISVAQVAPFITRSVELKNRVVTKDPTEKGLRKILNYGHTLGHAIESYCLAQPHRKRLLHGEAIAIGMILEAYLSAAITGLSKKERDNIRTAFLNYFEAHPFTKEEQKGIIELLQHDKKNRGGKVNFVLLEAIGKPAIDIVVSPVLFSDAFDYYHGELS